MPVRYGDRRNDGRIGRCDPLRQCRQAGIVEQFSQGNIYAELLGQRTTDLSRYFIDFAPAVQLIFRSAVKLNFGYRFELGSNMYRMTSRSWLMGLEWQFLNALKHHSSK